MNKNKNDNMNKTNRKEIDRMEMRSLLLDVYHSQ